MRGPQAYAEHLAREGYHPRSDAHSNAMCRGILKDLLDTCPPLARRAALGHVVAALNHTVIVGYQRWNIDLALGPPPGTPLTPEAGRIGWDVPTVIEMAVEVKGVMTEHGKARRNRFRDLNVFHSHAHAYDRKIVTGGLVVVNVSPVFWSPLRDADDITRHANIDRIGKETVELYRGLPLRDEATDGPGLEASCVIVVDHDNLATHPAPVRGMPRPRPSTLVTRAPAPPPGDPLSYGTFVHRLCRTYAERWCGRSRDAQEE